MTAPPPLYADVILPRHLHRTFTYAVPPALRGAVGIGTPVRVPFGKTVLEAVVIAVGATPGAGLRRAAGDVPPPAERLKHILAVSDGAARSDVAADLLRLSRDVADRYLAPWGQCLRLVLPPPATVGPARYRATDAGRSALATAGRGGPNRAESAVLAKLAASMRPLTAGTLARAGGRPGGTILNRLVRRGWIEAMPAAPAPARRTSRRHADDAPEVPTALPMIPTAAAPEPAWWPEFLSAVTARRPSEFLLHDRAPRQWRLILQAAAAVLETQRSVLIVSPSIARAEALAALARRQHGAHVESLHSGLRPQDRAGAWERIQAGGPVLVIGTRAAVFAPAPAIGLIAVEDEDDPALKEESEPRYHAREVARMRAERQRAIVLLASPHPSFETMVALNAVASASQPPPGLAPVTLMDMRRTPYGTLLSEPLFDLMQHALTAQDRIVLYINRKGFAPALQCRDCGASPSCPRCEIPLAFYKRRAQLGCHYCGTVAPLPDVCHGCGAARLEPSGIGTERVEETVRRLFPNARVDRLDRERAPNPRAAEAVRRRFNAGGIDILIGTQMLLQGPPLRTVGVVGLIQADAGLHLPDFRAGERTYHGLLDAVSVARPDGRVILQTFSPSHPAIDALAHGRPATFLEPELAFRKALGYPPFGHLIALRISGTQPGRVQDAARRCAGRLTALAASGMSVLGPAPAPIAHLRGRHRWQLLVKSPEAESMRAPVRQTLELLEAGPRSGIKYEVDVDPVEMI